MKFLGLLMLSVGTLAARGWSATFEDCSPAFSAEMPIVWAAPTNHIPGQFWTYKIVPRIFSTSAISNGIVMAGFQGKGFPKPSRKSVVIWADHPPGHPRPPYFAIHPDHGQMTFHPGLPAPDAGALAKDSAAVKRALRCAALLDINPADLSPTNCDLGLSGVFLSRQMDGFLFFRDTEGFSIQLGKDGKIMGFALLWPKLERDKICDTASLGQITQCIRQRRAMLLPEEAERNYFARVKELGAARKLTITKAIPYWGEGRFGEDPPEQAPPKYVSPAVELEAVADLVTNKVQLKLCTAILIGDVRVLLRNASLEQKGQKR